MTDAAPWILCLLLFAAVLALVVLLLKRSRSPYWESFDKVVNRIVRDIRADRYHPDVIISLGHFGLVLGGVVRSNFSSRKNHPSEKDGDFPTPLLFGFHRDFVTNSRDEDNRFLQVPSLVEMVRGRRILLTAGDVSSGEGARRLRDWMLGAGAEDVRLAALSMHPSANAPIEYVGEVIEKPMTRPWIYANKTSHTSEPKPPKKSETHSSHGSHKGSQGSKKHSSHRSSSSRSSSSRRRSHSESQGKGRHRSRSKSRSHDSNDH
jgi:hypoxanthine phosphoribosyltransferase